MEFVRISDTQKIVDYLSGTLREHLERGESVLWLIPGGSAIAIAVEVSKHLEAQSFTELRVTLTDERYGDIGHADSNWKQLEEAGFRLPGAQLHPVLSGADRATTTAAFADYLSTELGSVDYKIGLFGIGPDGHTAGILPHTPAVTSSGLAADYDAGSYQRITMTPPAISQLDEAVVYAMGAEKKPVLEALSGDVTVDDQPAQVLKQVPKLTIFNDQYNDQEED